MEKRVCSKCNVEKELGLFYKNKNCKYGRGMICLVCYLFARRERRSRNKDKYNAMDRSWKEKNKDRVMESRKKTIEKHKVTLLLKAKEYRVKNYDVVRQKDRAYKEKNREKMKEQHRQWSKNNREKVKNYVRARHESNPLIKLSGALRSRMYIAFKRKELRKGGATETLIGAPLDIAKKHIERQFKKGMTWENHGHGCWHIDHKIPLVSAKTEEELVKLCHYTNLQPMWAKENFSKGKKILNPIQTKLTI